MLTAGIRRRAAVLGSPISHSLSPALHRSAYAALGLDWSYDVHDVTAEALPRFVAGLDDSWAGLSLTMPLKEAVLGLLDGTEDRVLVTGACNTVVLGGGRREGYNTDVEGIVAALGPRLASRATRRPAGVSAARPVAVVLGGGATAASALVALGELGADAARVLARVPARARAALAAAERAGLAVEVLPLDAARARTALGGADLVVAAMPPGAADPLIGYLPAQLRGILLDVVYEPWPTRFAQAWRAAGGIAVAGDEMLLHQAAAQVRLMTGYAPPLSAMRRGMAIERCRRATAG